MYATSNGIVDESRNSMNPTGPREPPNPNEMAQRLTQLIQQGKAASVLPRVDELASVYRDHPGVLHAISEVALISKNFPDAIQFAERALALDKHSVRYKLQLAMCLVASNDQFRAGEVLNSIEPVVGDSDQLASMLASLYVRIDSHERAVKFYERAIELDSKNAKHYFSLAATYRFMGRLAEAEQACDNALECDPSEYEAYLIRADLRKQTEDNNHISRMESVLADGVDEYMGEVMLCHAIAKECEDVGQYEKSFRHLSIGAALRRKHLSYDVGKDLRIINRIIEVFSEGRMRQMRPSGCCSTAPIFVIGMPRTGTTLVERIIGSHSTVTSAGELPNFSQLMTRMVREQNVGQAVSQEEMIAASLDLDMVQLGESYVESTRGIAGETPNFIDKLPFNYLNVGLIHLALPNAKIVHVTRDPMDTCYAVFKTLFQRAYPFSYDLEDLGQYFVAYQGLMDHWHKLLPNRMHSISYEALVQDSETQSRRLIEHCGLDWEDQQSRFYESEAPSTTASASQVRQPVYSSSVGKWRNYERELLPLSRLLQTANVEIQR